VTTYQDGLKVVEALQKYRELLVSAYIERRGRIAYTDDNAKALDDMIRLRLAVRDTLDDESVRLSSHLMLLLDSSLRTSRLKSVNVDVGMAIESVEFLAESYLLAKRAGEPGDAAKYLDDLDMHVVTLCDNLTEQAQTIWRQIESDFGAVDALSRRIELNTEALNHVEKLLKSLNHIPIEVLYEYSSKDRDLRSVLQMRLVSAIERCREELSDALSRLNRSLFSFKRLAAQAMLVQDFVSFYDQPLTKDLPDYTDLVSVPTMFRADQPKILQGWADPSNDQLEVPFTELIQGLRKTPAAVDRGKSEPLMAEELANEVAELSISPFKEAIRSVFEECLLTEASISGCERLALVPEEIDLQIWLYGLLAEYSAMSYEHRELFRVELVGVSGSYFNANYYAEDVVICPS
jgi:hypothetical protein